MLLGFGVRDFLASGSSIVWRGSLRVCRLPWGTPVSPPTELPYDSWVGCARGCSSFIRSASTVEDILKKSLLIIQSLLSNTLALPTPPPTAIPNLPQTTIRLIITIIVSVSSLPIVYCSRSIGNSNALSLQNQARLIYCTDSSSFLSRCVAFRSRHLFQHRFSH